MKVIDNYPDERLRWLIANYEGTGATSRCEAELAQMLLDAQETIEDKESYIGYLLEMIRAYENITPIRRKNETKI